MLFSFISPPKPITAYAKSLFCSVLKLLVNALAQIIQQPLFVGYGLCFGLQQSDEILNAYRFIAVTVY